MQCWSCHKSFSATVNTIFHNSHVDLQKWFLLISLMFSAKKGLSAMQAARDLDMRRPTVWSMMHRIRAAMKDDGKLLAGIVEMDETFIGGKPRKKNRRDDDTLGGDTSKRGRGTDKEAVVGIIERNGKVKAKPVDKCDMTAEQMAAFIRASIDTAHSVLNTDEWNGYNGVNNMVIHRRVNHRREYKADDMFSAQYGSIHTNTIEGFWAIVKRAIYGQFHHVSKKYLGLYIGEIVYRFNNRRNDNAFHDLLSIAVKP
ncbi:MAG: IS1595 family transposase [Patescibacteria group bacterium]|nr:IS1595 family transposase [Patescibacteria group bacterium]